MDLDDLWGRPVTPAPLDRGGLHFACERDDFLASTAGNLLGSFDGRDARDLHAYAVAPGEEQLLVSIHEHLHHELQWSTGWGLVGAMAGLLAVTGRGPDRLRAVADYANQRARHVHEVFATTVSAGVLGVQEGRRLMAGNRRYLRYLDQGLSLGGDPKRWPWQFRESAAQMLLRCLMQPRELLPVAETGFENLTLDRLNAITPPDARLLRTTAAGTWWDGIFVTILGLDPSRGGDTGGPWGRTLPDNEDAMERLKEFEETLLIPRLAETAQHRLRDLGIACLDAREYLRTADLLRDSFVKLAPPDWQVELLTERRKLGQEPLGAERERIQLHEARAVAELTTAEEFDDARFVLHTNDGQPAILATYLTGLTYATQFGMAELAAVPAVLALAGWPSLDDRNTRHVPFALLAPPLTPKGVEDAFDSLPVVVLTSLSLTRDTNLRDHVLDLQTAFVLVDLPLNLQISYWVDDGWTVRFSAIDLRSKHGLTLLLFALDELPGMYFLSYRSAAGFGELAQLLDRHQGKLLSGLDPGEEVVRGVTAVSSWLLSSWWRLQEAENLDTR